MRRTAHLGSKPDQPLRQYQQPSLFRVHPRRRGVSDALVRPRRMLDRLDGMVRVDNGLHVRLDRLRRFRLQFIR